VLAQTFEDWELIVSDDETGANASRAYVEELSRHDGRVRLLVNEGVHGQAGNLNGAMAAARGAWIKPVYDDDRLLPTCLERMLESVALSPGTVVARCLTERHEAGGAVKRPRNGRRDELEALWGPDAVLALFVQDVEIGTPTQILVRREAVHGGAWFPSHGRIVGGVDERTCCSTATCCW
jgi:glycosyltransferase involved in cell wall biosynthesis